MSEVHYELKVPFEYAYKGDMKEASFIAITAPSIKQVNHFIPIKQAFMAAATEVSKTIDTTEVEASDDGGDMDAAAIMPVMMNWSGDLSKVLIHAQELFKTGVALLDGETKLTTPMMEKMTLDDFEGLLAIYIANFIAPSLMGGR